MTVNQDDLNVGFKRRFELERDHPRLYHRVWWELHAISHHHMDAVTEHRIPGPSREVTRQEGDVGGSISPTEEDVHVHVAGNAWALI